MEYEVLHETDIKISRIGIGSWALGGPNWKEGRSEGWSKINRADALEALSFAVDNGITHFDSADIYGNGEAERLLAQGIGSASTTVTLSSKVGWFRGTAPHAYEAGHIRSQCEQSLRNLQRDYLDIYYLHHSDFGKDDQYLDEAVEVMQRLKDEGKIRAIGFSTYTYKAFSKYIPYIQPAVVQGWAHLLDYHFIARNSPLLNLCEKYHCNFIGYQPFDQGILLDKYSPDMIPAFEDGDHRGESYKFQKSYLDKAQKGLQQSGEEFGTSLKNRVSTAIRFVLSHKGVTGTLAGFRNKKQVEMLLQNDILIPFKGGELARLYQAFKGE